MSIVQAWLLFGLPALILALALFVGRSQWRAALGYVVLAAGFAGLLTVHATSAAAFGGLLVLLLAAGRGGAGERAREVAADAAAPEADVPGWVGSDRTLKPGRHG